MKSVLKKPPNIASCLANSETSAPCTDPCVLGTFGQEARLASQLAGDLQTVGISVGCSRSGDQTFAIDGGVGRLVTTQSLLNPERMKCGDVPAMSGVLNG